MRESGKENTLLLTSDCLWDRDFVKSLPATTVPDTPKDVMNI